MYKKLQAIQLLAVPAISVLLVGCSGDKASDTPATETTGAPSAPVSSSSVHDVVCGCVIEDVGVCGEYADVDGKFMELTGDLGLGSMPFCGKEGLRAKMAGEVKDGKYAVTSFELADL